MQYIIDNKEQIFSGIGCLVISTIIGIILYKIRNRKNNQEKDNTEEKSTEQKTDNSTRTVNQYGNKSLYFEENKGDININ